MKLGIAIDWAGADLSVPMEQITLAERLGYDSVWSAEAYGSDAITPLAYIAAHTERIRLGTGIIQIAARTPAATAMAMSTVDALAGGGRVICGLGVSGPQIVEGWYGQPWGSPVTRLRDYVTIMRKVFRREGPVSHAGSEISLPYTGPGSTGEGKPLKSILHTDPATPIWLGCGGRRSVELCAELCDGWLPMGLTPETWETYRPWVEAGFAAAGGGKSLADFEIQGGVSVEVTDDLEAAWKPRKQMIGFYVGGMGSRRHNFHKESMVRRGFPEAAERIQALFLAGKREEAYAAVPDEYVDDAGLYGDEARIRERYERYVGSPFTGLTVRPSDPETLELMADVAGLRAG